MVMINKSILFFCAVWLLSNHDALSQETPGTIRGAVFDKDLKGPLIGASVLIVETGQIAKTDAQGGFSIADLKPGKYTVTFSKEGYVREVRSAVAVTSGRLTDLEASLAGDFADLEEFVVQDPLSAGGGTEAAVLTLRLESPSLIDAISSELMSRAGASDAASAMTLIAGATVQDGKSAVIRGLPDRYVSSQLNGVRLPTADENKRAVELDQFPSAIIESIDVSKTFTPDQQGDASGGAVDLRMKRIPDGDPFFKFSSQVGFNSQVKWRGDFLTYKGVGVNFWGRDDGDRDQQLENVGSNWLGAVGASQDDAPTDYKWSLASGGSHTFDSGLKIGGFASLFYERDTAFSDRGIDDSYWVENPGDPMTPQQFQGTAKLNDFKTGLFDVTRAKKTVQWGTLLSAGLEYEQQAINFTYLYTRTAEDKVTLAEDTRGKAYYFPGHDPYDPTTPGHEFPDSAPYLRLETLDYTERTTQTFQIRGTHVLPYEPFGFEEVLVFGAPELDWTMAFSSAGLYQPDKRQFGSLWTPERELFPGFSIPANHRPFLPAANFNLGFVQRIWKRIEEDSEQYAVNLKLPFEQWTGDQGFFKVGYFNDSVMRSFNQDTFSNFGDAGSILEAPFEQRWSQTFPFETHPIFESQLDVDYEGELTVEALYAMVSVPLTSNLKLTGGIRFEWTEIGIINEAEAQATWFPPSSLAVTQLNPGDADVAFEQADKLPSIGLEYKPFDELTLRGAYNETVARQTFKELTPILQQEFLGGPIFVGNPTLQMSEVKNYDLRADYVPYAGGLISASWFKKDLKNPIEYVQKLATFNFTTAVNYPEGSLTGFEFEIRQSLGHLVDALEGLSIGANATFIDSEVRLPDDEFNALNLPNILAATRTRDMTNAPEHLFNFYVTYDLPDTGTQFSLFYTIKGDTLLAGAGEAGGNFVPSVYAKEFGTLNFSASQRIGNDFRIQFQAKNLTNSKIEQVYRSEFIGDDVLRSSDTKGIEFSLTVGGEFRF
jgi:outer membrane receptor protein involved in Fe transport